MKNRYPFSKQEGLKDCGAASLQMVIRYYGGYVSIDELNEMLGTTKNGTSAFDLIETGKKLGFESYGIKIGLNDMKLKNLIFPIIVYTTINEKYNHFMVVYNINFRTKKIIVADPQSNIKKMRFDEFNKIYNNVSLIFYPNKPIVRKNEISLKGILNSLLKKYRNEVKLLIVFSIILILFSILSSFYIKILFDNFELSKNLLLIIFFIFLVVNLFKIVTNYLRTHLLIKISEKISFELNMDALYKVINLPYRYYNNKTTGEILSKVVGLEKVQDTINKIVIALFIDLPLALFSMIVLSIINFKLFCISIGFLVLYILIFYIPKKYIATKTEDYYISRTNYISFLQETISGFESIKNLNLENIIFEKNEMNYIKHLNEIKRLDKIFNLQYTFKEFISCLNELIVAFVGILLVNNGNISIGNLLAFNSMQVFFFTPIRNVIDLDSCIVECKKIIKRVYELFENTEKKEIKIDSIHSIRIKNLSYINSNVKILNKINLTIKKGEKIMLTGKSGSGKSTFLKILMGYLKIDKGVVDYNEVDIRHISNLRDKISYISQNESLFTDSLKNNIQLYNGDFNSVVKDFYLNEIVSDKQLGYNMIIEENGFNISGGQKQRIVLARACMKPFEILFIDEGLNQIDVNLERKILKNMFERYHDKTIIIVSHRKNNIDLYDRVLEMKKGEIFDI